jgi:hypothetical protein
MRYSGGVDESGAEPVPTQTAECVLMSSQEQLAGTRVEACLLTLPERGHRWPGRWRAPWGTRACPHALGLVSSRGGGRRSVSARGREHRPLGRAGIRWRGRAPALSLRKRGVFRHPSAGAHPLSRASRVSGPRQGAAFRVRVGQELRGRLRLFLPPLGSGPAGDAGRRRVHAAQRPRGLHRRRSAIVNAL